MTPEQFKRVEDLFERALERVDHERTSFVEREASDDALVRQKVERMLRQDRRTDGYLATPALGADFRLVDPEEVERTLLQELAQAASVRVTEKLGEGGFGAVYKAEQLGPVRRWVAIKVIKLGMDTQQVLGRFQAERQTLAMMDHPAIAKVYEAGATPSGRPYFAMELVDGQPITRYCDANRMDIHARLRLLMLVCNGVQHAHQKGVIHRDLKPGNILVSEQDGQPSPKIIDFGIARAVGEVTSPRSYATAQGQPLGTPIYMSPEQATGSTDIDTRTDVYSLGVVLYELLTGEPSARVDSRSIAMPSRVVEHAHEGQVQPPSHRVRGATRRGMDLTLSDQRRTTPALLAKTLRGELDWIVLTALEHDRTRRYETVAALSDDIGRYLTGEPVRAHPPTTGYRLVKYMKRHRVPLAIVGLIALALIGTTVGLVRSLSAESRARTEAQIASEINTFLNDDLLSAVDPNELGSDARVRDVVDEASRRVEGKFASEPEIEAAIRLTLGRTYTRLVEFDRASQHLDRARALREKLFGPSDDRVLDVLHEMGELRTLQEDYTNAEAFLKKAYSGRRKTLGENDSRTLASQYALGVAIAELGRYSESEVLLADALRRCQATLGPTAKQTLTAHRGLAVLWQAMGKNDAARAVYEECYNLSREAYGLANPTTLLTMKDLANLLLVKGENSRALDLMLEVVKASKTIRGERHAGTLMAMGTLAQAYQASGDTPRAEQVNLQALALAQEALPAGHGVTMKLTMLQASIYDRAGDHERAEPLLRRALDTLRERLGEESPLTREARQGLATHYRARGMIVEAEKTLHP